jgi:hypothetical protein
MTFFLNCSISWQIAAATSSEIQTIFVAISVIVVIAAMLFAGYILIRNNGHVKPEIPPFIVESPPIYKDNDSLPKDTIVQPIEEHLMTDNPAEEHLMTGTPAEEHQMTGTPAKEHQMASALAEEHLITSIPVKEYKPLFPPSLIVKTLATLKISDLKIVPPNSKAGELIAIWLTATNLDSRQITHEIVLKINNQVFNTRIISILPGTIQHLHFKVPITEPGSYTADINGTTGTFTVS